MLLHYHSVLVTTLPLLRLHGGRRRELGRGGNPGTEAGDQGRSDARGAGRRAPVLIILTGGDERRGRSQKWHERLQRSTVRLGEKRKKEKQNVFVAGQVRLGMMGLQHTPPRLPGEVLVCCSARAHEGRAPP